MAIKEVKTSDGTWLIREDKEGNTVQEFFFPIKEKKTKKDGSNSIYLPRHPCMMIWSGIKTQIVKEKPFEGMLHKELYLCDDHYFYGEIELTSMKEASRKEVERDVHLNRVFGEDWEDWKGAKTFYVYEFVFEAVFEPQVVEVPTGVQTFFTLGEKEVDRIEKIRTSEDFIGLMRKAAETYDFVYHRHYGEDIHTHFDVRWKLSSTHKREINIYHDLRRMEGRERIPARFKDITESEESLKEWMITEGTKVERHVTGVKTPTYVDVLDHGTLQILDKTKDELVLLFNGEHLEGEFKFHLTGSMEELTKDEEHGPKLLEYDEVAKEGEPFPPKYYKWQPKVKTSFVLQSHYPTGQKIPIKLGEKVPEMHKGFVAEYDEEHPEDLTRFLSALFDQFEELPQEEKKSIGGTPFGDIFSGLVEKIRDHLDLRLDTGEKLKNGPLIGYTIHPPVPGGISAWESLKERLKPDTKTQVTPKYKEGVPRDWLTREGKLYFPTRHKDVPEQEAHYIEVAQMDIVDKGEVKFGVQRKDSHEYFFYGKHLEGRWVFRRLKIGKEFQHEAWIMMKPEDQKPMDPSYHKDEGYFKIDPIPGKVTSEEREHIEEEVHRAREERGEEV